MRRLMSFGRRWQTRLSPNLQGTFNPLLTEDLLPGSVANGDELAIVVEIEESLERRLWLSPGEVGELVESVEMHLVGAPICVPTLE
jgi:hypothetical protein